MVWRESLLGRFGLGDAVGRDEARRKGNRSRSRRRHKKLRWHRGRCWNGVIHGFSTLWYILVAMASLVLGWRVKGLRIIIIVIAWLGPQLLPLLIIFAVRIKAVVVRDGPVLGVVERVRGHCRVGSHGDRRQAGGAVAANGDGNSTTLFAVEGEGADQAGRGGLPVDLLRSVGRGSRGSGLTRWGKSQMAGEKKLALAADEAKAARQGPQRQSSALLAPEAALIGCRRGDGFSAKSQFSETGGREI